ncbi:hypothetical protein B0T09DRAFT_396773 [Sordaria sp. MPI-SDFR-AT-0083]|nr:hypothetical protein B0T09DRAFT_396773 [Sordaria sp. MPI-SDFR-AT-0083]
MFNRLLRAFSPRNKKSKSQPLLRFAVRKSHEDNRTARNRLRKRLGPAPTPVPSPALERSQDDSILASYQTRPWPSVNIDRHGEERYPRGDSPLVDALRGRSKSSPPPRTRAPTPYPSASKSQNLKREKTVRWGSPLETRLGTPAEEEGKTKTERDDLTTPTKEPATRTTPSNGDAPNGHSAMKEEDVRVSANEARPLQPLRRNRRSSIPRPKRQVSTQDSSKPTAFVADMQERPFSSLIPQAMPAPLRIPTKRHSLAQSMASSATVPVIAAKPKDKSSTTDSSRKKKSTTTVPNYSRPTRSSRDYSFENKPEVLAISSRSSHQRDICEPRRPDFANAVRTQTATVALAKSCTTLPSEEAEDLWNEVGSMGNSNSDAPKSMPKSSTTPVMKTYQHDVPSKPPASAIPVSPSRSSFQAVKSFWDELSTTSSCHAVVSGSGGGSPVVLGTCKTSKVAELSTYTVNSQPKGLVVDVGGSRGVAGAPPTGRSRTLVVPDHRFSRITKPSSATVASCKTESDLSKASSSSGTSYHTAKTHLTPSNAGSLAPSATASVATSSSRQAQYTPSIQSQLWNDLMEFCTPNRDHKSKSSFCAPYCACDDCLWQNESEIDLSSNVARIGRC